MRRQFYHHQAHGPQSHPTKPVKGLHPSQEKGRSLGRRIPYPPHRRLTISPDSPGPASRPHRSHYLPAPTSQSLQLLSHILRATHYFDILTFFTMEDRHILLWKIDTASRSGFLRWLPLARWTIIDEGVGDRVADEAVLEADQRYPHEGAHGDVRHVNCLEKNGIDHRRGEDS